MWDRWGLLPNLRFPTLGGRQVWADRRIACGWRVQQHISTGHARLLDPRDQRRAWGDFNAVTDAYDSQALSPGDAGSVVLLHGIGRTRFMFRHLMTGLRQAGFHCVDVGYPSTRRSLLQHARQLGEILDHLPGTGPVRFITHSMGALVVRLALSLGDGSWRQRHHPDGLCMVFPPNRGAYLADLLHGFGPFRALYGHAGQSLTSARARKLPIPDIPFSIVVGGQGTTHGRNPILRGDDDGTVRVVEAILPGAESINRYPLDHTFGLRDATLCRDLVAWALGGELGGTKLLI
jgi:hypothetical protein